MEATLRLAVVALLVSCAALAAPSKSRADYELGIDMSLGGGAAFAEGESRGLFDLEATVDLLYTPEHGPGETGLRWAVGPTVGYAFGLRDEHALLGGLTLSLGHVAPTGMFDTIGLTVTAGALMLVSTDPTYGAAFTRLFAGWRGPSVLSFKWATFGLFVETRVYPALERTDVIVGVAFDVGLLIVGPLALLFETMSEPRPPVRGAPPAQPQQQAAQPRAPAPAPAH